MGRAGVFAFAMLTGLLLGGMIMTKTVEAEAKMGQTKNALVIVDPGFLKFSLRIGENISKQLIQRGYRVKLVVAKRFKPRDIAGVELLVLGGPIYGGRPGEGLKKTIGLLENVNGVKTLLYVAKGLPQDEWEPLEILVAQKGLAVIGKGKFLVRSRKEADVTKGVQQLLKQLHD